MGSSYLDGNELRTRALNWADSLAARSNESVRIGTLHEGQALVVHHVFRPDNSRQALEVGALLPGHATALGKVLLAYGAASLPAGRLERPTEKTITGRAELQADLAAVRAQGYAITDSELEPGLVAVAAPVRRDGGAVVAALSVSGPATRLTPATLPGVAAQCVAQADALSCVLGHRPQEPPQPRLERPQGERAAGQQAKEGAA